MKELSVFVDESGDFGAYDHHSPMYLFSLLFHDQKEDISQLIGAYRREMDQIDPSMNYFHAGPMIRREEEYRSMDIHLRRRAFNKMSFLVNHLPIHYATVMTEKKHVDEKLELSLRLSKPFGQVLTKHLPFFQDFDVVKLYYDNGQKELSKLLAVLFGTFVNDVEFKIVKPCDYILFQVADYLSTLELVYQKFVTKTASKSEIYFFGGASDFYRNYYRRVLPKKL